MLTWQRICLRRECISCSRMQANLPYSECRQQSPAPGCFIYNRTLSSDGVSGEGWRQCGKQTWLHPSAFQITGEGGRDRRAAAWCIRRARAQGERSSRDKEITEEVQVGEGGRGGKREKREKGGRGWTQERELQKKERETNGREEVSERRDNEK